jgi:hypothetical protein
MQMIRRLTVWFWRAWPVLVMFVLASGHIYAISKFPSATVLVNKLTGTVMQIVGGLIVLRSVDANLGLFRNQSLVATVLAWFRECPIFVKSITILVGGTAQGLSVASARASLTRAVTTIEERLAEVERRMDEIRSELPCKTKQFISESKR